MTSPPISSFGFSETPSSLSLGKQPPPLPLSAGQRTGHVAAREHGILRGGGGPGCFAGPCFGFLSGAERPPRLTTGYGDFRGLGAPMRMMCAYAGAAHEDMKYAAVERAAGSWSSPEWDRHKPELADVNPLVRLPYVINHATGEVVAQSNAVYLYLGRLLRLEGRTRQERLANEQVLFHMHIMWTQLRDLVYPEPGSRGTESDAGLVFRTRVAEHLKAILPEHYDKLEAWLRLRGSDFIAGPSPCTADFHVWEFVDQQEALARRYCYDSPVEDYPLLQAFYHRFRALPRLKGYFDGPDFLLPINNKMAFFY